MKQKKEKSTILVLFTIFILLVFIVLPPVFRAVFPKTISNEINQTTEKIDVLYCKIDDLEEGYNISIHVRYLNGKIKKNTITYTPITASDGNNYSSKDMTNFITVSKQFELFNSIDDIDINNNSDGSVVVTINEDSINSSDNNEITDYFMNLEKQKQFFVNQGYQCNVISN